MNRLGSLLSFLLVLAFLQFPFEKAAAETTPYFTFNMDCKTASAQETVKLKVRADGTGEAPAGFRISISYDADTLIFDGVEGSSQVKSGTLRTNSGDSAVTSVYVCNTGKSGAPALSGVILSYSFSVADGAPQGKANLHIEVDQVCDYGGSPMDYGNSKDLTLTVTPALSDEAVLSDLVPSSGKLKPDFSPDIYDYSLTVGYSVASVIFEADADKDGTVKINRRTLYTAGSQTPILVTVTSQDGRAKAEYRVVVYRLTNQVSNPPYRPAAEHQADASSAPPPEDSSGRDSSDGEEIGFLKNGSSGKSKGIQVASGASSGTGYREEIEQEEVALPSEQTIIKQQTDTGEGRALVIEHNQMPAFATGILSVTLCAVLGIALNLWLSSKPKQP